MDSHPDSLRSGSQRLWGAVGERVEAATGVRGRPRILGTVAGGDINQAVKISYGGSYFLVKLNDAGRLAMFEAEALGLKELGACGALRVPRALGWGRVDNSAFLVLEFLDLRRGGDAARLGEGLARLHRATWDHYGWHRDNTIGATPQVNQPGDDWVRFWRQHRLGFQLDLAKRNGYRQLQPEAGRLLEEFHLLFGGYTPPPSLLHGDLWCGNFAYLETGEPVVFDPAVYFGDRETDLAMTELFGDFGTEFQAAYRAHWPLDAGYAQRRHLYQLYHILNHLNLFGSGYLARAQGTIHGLLAQLG